jgi:hypothetical protein
MLLKQNKNKQTNKQTKNNRGEWGCMKRKIVGGKMKHSCYFSAKTSLMFVSTKNKVRVSFCLVFHTAPFTPIGSGSPISIDPKSERRPPAVPWPTFHKSNDPKLFLISVLKALKSLETFKTGLAALSGSSPVSNIFSPDHRYMN